MKLDHATPRGYTPVGTNDRVIANDPPEFQKYRHLSAVVHCASNAKLMLDAQFVEYAVDA